MGPVGAIAYEPVEEQAGDRCSGKAIGGAVAQVGDIAFEVLAVTVIQRQAPARVIRFKPGGPSTLRSALGKTVKSCQFNFFRLSNRNLILVWMLT